jgi:hypothetical protein
MNLYGMSTPPQHASTVQSHLLLNAVAMGEAALEGDIDELRFRSHLLLMDIQGCGLGLSDLEDQVKTLVHLLGPVASTPDGRFGAALCELASLVEKECIGRRWTEGPNPA